MSGQGGTAGPPPGYMPPTVPGVAAGSPNPVSRVTQIIVTPGGGVQEGIFTYSSTPPAAGTLIETAGIPAAGVDKYGNNFLAGHSSYQAGFAVSVIAGAVLFYTGSLAAGWTFQAQVLIDGSGNMFLEPGGGGVVNVAGNLSVSGNAVVTGTLSVNGSTSTGTPSNNSTSTNGLPNGTISGTSGAASAGTAHTHGGGSYAVTNGQHNHDLQSHLHVL